MAIPIFTDTLAHRLIIVMFAAVGWLITARGLARMRGFRPLDCAFVLSGIAAVTYAIWTVVNWRGI